jgi:hypothetical protein
MLDKKKEIKKEILRLYIQGLEELSIPGVDNGLEQNVSTVSVK